MLYHGTIIEGLNIIKANAHSHSSNHRVAYFTEDRCYALVCCLNKNENFVTMGLKEDGKQHYYERFPNQLETLYRHKNGFIYKTESINSLKKTNGHTWKSEIDVPVSHCEIVTDLYFEILKEEKLGNIIIHRYEEIDPVEQKMHANYIKTHLSDQGEKMEKFYLTHFQSLWD